MRELASFHRPPRPQSAPPGRDPLVMSPFPPCLHLSSSSSSLLLLVAISPTCRSLVPPQHSGRMRRQQPTSSRGREFLVRAQPFPETREDAVGHDRVIEPGHEAAAATGATERSFLLQRDDPSRPLALVLIPRSVSS
eukprot:766393-Hanusia_phi.AAC.7